MSEQNKKKTVKQIVRKFIADECIFVEELKNESIPKISWGFVFHHPPFKNSPVFQISKHKKRNFLIYSAKIGFNPEIINQIKGTDKGKIILSIWKKILFAKTIDFEINQKEFIVKLSIRIYTNNRETLEERLYFNLRKIFLTGMSIFDALIEISGINFSNNNKKKFSDNMLYS